jgi:LPS sulfotransferase NodH
VVLGTERSGTNLLGGLLDSHPKCTMGEELFNPTIIADHVVPWYIIGVGSFFNEEECKEFDKLRAQNPIEFIDKIYSSASERGYSSVGFKYMYSHVLKHREVIEHLLADPDILFIHIIRRNLFRRFVSEKQAEASGIWAQQVYKNEIEHEPLKFEFNHVIWDLFDKIGYIEYYKGYFSNKNNYIEVYYEDLASRPQAVANRVIRFLGLEVQEELEVRWRKTGTDSLRKAVANYDVTKARLRHWLSFFED